MFEGRHQPASPRVTNEKKKRKGNWNTSTSIPLLTGDHAFIDICIASWEEFVNQDAEKKKEIHILSFCRFDIKNISCVLRICYI